MKTRIATVLSVAGELTAGSAAALVNTQVLDSSKHHSASPALIVPVVAPAASLQSAFQVGEAGLVTVDTPGDVLAMVSTVPTCSTATSARR